MREVLEKFIQKVEYEFCHAENPVHPKKFKFDGLPEKFVEDFVFYLWGERLYISVYDFLSAHPIVYAFVYTAGTNMATYGGLDLKRFLKILEENRPTNSAEEGLWYETYYRVRCQTEGWYFKPNERAREEEDDLALAHLIANSSLSDFLDDHEYLEKAIGVCMRSLTYKNLKEYFTYRLLYPMKHYLNVERARRFLDRIDEFAKLNRTVYVIDLEAGDYDEMLGLRTGKTERF